MLLYALVDVNTLKVGSLADRVEPGPAVTLVPSLDDHTESVGPTVDFSAVVSLTFKRAHGARHRIADDAFVKDYSGDLRFYRGGGEETTARKGTLNRPIVP